jgi:hypothetical protein
MRGKLDANHPEIVRAIKQFGGSVLSLADLGDGAPDILVGFRGKNILMEIKDGMQPPSKRQLTEDEKVFHSTWGGSVLIVESVQAALKFLNSIG